MIGVAMRPTVLTHLSRLRRDVVPQIVHELCRATLVLTRASAAASTLQVSLIRIPLDG